MNKVEQAYNEIKIEAQSGNKTICPAGYTWSYGKVASASAFKKAIKDNIIKVSYKSVSGTPVYEGV